MATLKAFIRTGKKDGIVNVRFRLSDGRSVQLFHKSEITVLSSLWDDKLERHKTRSLVKEKERAALTIAIANRKRLIEDLYKANKLITSLELDLLIDKNLNPQKYNIQTEDLTVIGLFKKYVSSWIEKGVIGEGRKKHYDVVIRELTRFFVINSMDDFMPEEFTKDVIFAFREFLRNEYTFVETYDYLYAGMNARNRPSRERSQNTISEKLQIGRASCRERVYVLV